MNKCSPPRALMLLAHPLEDSYTAAVAEAARDGLAMAGWETDIADLYADGFDPVLTAAERRAYHDPGAARAVEPWIERVEAAQMLAIVSPVWNFGYPAILKGFFDRVFLPGVAFSMRKGRVAPGRLRPERLAALHSYGGTRVAAALAGDPPRHYAKRVLRRLLRPRRLDWLPIYDMNRASEQRRKAHLARVRAVLSR